ncbi:MAG: hypothetical protein CMJ75_06205 [Planctomycetaceae bacterium]|nr:hypothetical protein [Planctomycetaceae bacterium]
MGIEPTSDAVNAPPNGFEDRGRHQACKHFLIKEPEGWERCSSLQITRFEVASISSILLEPMRYRNRYVILW